MTIAIQYAVDYQTFMVFLYMYVSSRLLLPDWSKLTDRICNSKIPAVMLMGKHHFDIWRDGKELMRSGPEFPIRTTKSPSDSSCDVINSGFGFR